MRHFFTVIGAVALLSMHAAVAGAPGKPIPRMSGQEFVARFFNSVGVPLGKQTTKMLVERELALGYVAGVADAAQGTQWYDKGRVKTIDIDTEIAHAMRTLPPDALQQNAGALIVQLLKKRFPCN